MGKAKKKQLPKDFEALLENHSFEELKLLFDTYDVNARGGVFKQTVPAFHQCPDALARWLVARGADLAAGDRYGDTPLHSRARHWKGRIDVLLELGADVNQGENDIGTPLHAAAGRTMPSPQACCFSMVRASTHSIANARRHSRGHSSAAATRRSSAWLR